MLRYFELGWWPSHSFRKSISAKFSTARELRRVNPLATQLCRIGQRPRWSPALKLSGFAAPFFRCHVSDGLRKSPKVAGEILDTVLTLTIRVIRGFANN